MADGGGAPPAPPAPPAAPALVRREFPMDAVQNRGGVRLLPQNGGGDVDDDIVYEERDDVVLDDLIWEFGVPSVHNGPPRELGSREDGNVGSVVMCAVPINNHIVGCTQEGRPMWWYIAFDRFDKDNRFKGIEKVLLMGPFRGKNFAYACAVNKCFYEQIGAGGTVNFSLGQFVDELANYCDAQQIEDVNVIPRTALIAGGGHEVRRTSVHAPIEQYRPQRYCTVSVRSPTRNEMCKPIGYISPSIWKVAVQPPADENGLMPDLVCFYTAWGVWTKSAVKLRDFMESWDATHPHATFEQVDKIVMQVRMPVSREPMSHNELVDAVQAINYNMVAPNNAIRFL